MWTAWSYTMNALVVGVAVTAMTVTAATPTTPVASLWQRFSGGFSSSATPSRPEEHITIDRAAYEEYLRARRVDVATPPPSPPSSWFGVATAPVDITAPAVAVDVSDVDESSTMHNVQLAVVVVGVLAVLLVVMVKALRFVHSVVVYMALFAPAYMLCRVGEWCVCAMWWRFGGGGALASLMWTVMPSAVARVFGSS